MEEIYFSKQKMNDIHGAYVWEPAGEHCTDRLGMAEESHMVKHWVTEHSDMPELPKFNFKVVALFKDALTGQDGETVMTHLRGRGVLNRKSEYTRCRIPRLTKDRGDWQKMKSSEKKELETARGWTG